MTLRAVGLICKLKYPFSSLGRRPCLEDETTKKAHDEQRLAGAGRKKVAIGPGQHFAEII
jgi:hypothetical protein